MQPVIDFIKTVFLFHKMKIFLFFTFCILFFIVFFPLTELGEKVVSETNASGLVYLEFEKMELSFFPRPAVVMAQAVIESPMLEQIEVQEFKVAPSILAMIQFAFTKKLKPFATVSAEGLFGGNLEADTSSSSKIKDPEALELDLDYEGFDLKLLAKSLGPQWPVAPAGQGNLKAKVDVDPSMKTQPEGTLEMVVDQVVIPQFDLPTSFGPMSIPALNFRKVVLKGQLKNGKLSLKETQLGGSQDEISLKISGDIELRIFPGGTPNVSFYNLAIDLNLKKSMEAKLGGAAGAIQSYLGKFGTSNSEGQRYAFRVQGNGFNDPMPQFSPL